MAYAVGRTYIRSGQRWIAGFCRTVVDAARDRHRDDLVWAFLHCGMSDGFAGAASLGCHRCLQ
jgi:hypothetical protein